MNIDKIPEEFEKIIDTEMNKNPLIYSFYKRLTDCGLNNSDDCAEYLAKGLVILLISENRSLRDILIRGLMRKSFALATPEHGFNLEHIRQSPTFVTSTPESMSVEEFGKRYSLASSMETGRKIAEDLKHAMAVPKEMLGEQDINHWIPDTDALKALRENGDNIKFHAGNVKGDSLYLAKTYESVDDQSDIWRLIFDAKQNINIHTNPGLKIEASPESKKQIMNFLNDIPSTFDEKMAAENIFGGMKVEELVKRDGYFIGICYDI